MSGERGLRGDLTGWRNVAVVAFPLHFAVATMAEGFRYEVLAIDVIALALSLIPRTRAFCLVLMPIYVMGLCYESFGVTFGLRPEIHVGDVYAAELSLFGINNTAGELVIPAAFFLEHTTAFLDAICGIAYIGYILIPPVLVIYLFLKDEREGALQLSFMMLVVNLLGMFIWVIYPVAPPWYVFEYGLGPAFMDAAPNAAGALRFDELLNTTYFQEFYQRNRNVFGAMPSLHTAYPTFAALGIWGFNRSIGWATAGFAVLVGFSAVYLQHHYILDVLAGVVCACVAYLIVSLGFRAYSAWSRPRGQNDTRGAGAAIQGVS